jgi:hypothetical protein
VDPVGSGKGPVAGCCEYGDESPASGATDLVSYLQHSGSHKLMPEPHTKEAKKEVHFNMTQHISFMRKGAKYILRLKIIEAF